VYRFVRKSIKNSQPFFEKNGKISDTWVFFDPHCIVNVLTSKRVLYKAGSIMGL